MAWRRCFSEKGARRQKFQRGLRSIPPYRLDTSEIFFFSTRVCKRYDKIRKAVCVELWDAPHQNGMARQM